MTRVQIQEFPSLIGSMKRMMKLVVILGEGKVSIPYRKYEKKKK